MMPRAAYRYRRRRYNAGRERALQHIEEARRLTEELGGTDQDVKEYFFSLPNSELRAILDEYEVQFGSAAREYAEQTIEKWSNGRVKMSGMVASRLFQMLPPRMPLSEKYRLIENLWNHVGPRSKHTLRIGLNSTVEQVLLAVRKHIDELVVRYRIPDNLERRFEWLAVGDAQVKQELLNHLRNMEKTLVEQGTREQFPIMLDHLRSDESRHTHRMAQIIRVGNHELELLFDKKASGVALHPN